VADADAALVDGQVRTFQDLQPDSCVRVGDLNILIRKVAGRRNADGFRAVQMIRINL